MIKQPLFKTVTQMANKFSSGAKEPNMKCLTATTPAQDQIGLYATGFFH